mmetsp:Transcript_26012/g.80368  ORF Transcript_26012/g.80368 Transcript_26012/m.80368 type:complete len:250 (-) Transcript_26012:2468-3217(-)
MRLALTASSTTPLQAAASGKSLFQNARAYRRTRSVGGATMWYTPAHSATNLGTSAVRSTRERRRYTYWSLVSGDTGAKDTNPSLARRALRHSCTVGKSDTNVTHAYRSAANAVGGHPLEEKISHSRMARRTRRTCRRAAGVSRMNPIVSLTSSFTSPWSDEALEATVVDSASGSTDAGASSAGRRKWVLDAPVDTTAPASSASIIAARTASAFGNRSGRSQRHRCPTKLATHSELPLVSRIQRTTLTIA